MIMLRKFRSLTRRIRDHWRFGGARQVSRLLRGLVAERCGTWLFCGFDAKARSCPCCGWEGRRFRPYFAGGYTTLDAECPACGSHARHRGHIRYYRETLRLHERQGRCLYFAPEQGVLPYLKAAPGLDVETTGFDDDGSCDRRYDIMEIDAAPDTYDVVLCHRVVEHVPDDRQALRELYRILKPGGIAVISVPISRARQTTIEYGRPNPLCDDHYYDYGMDFRRRIPSEFECRELLFSRLFDPVTFKRLALFEDSIFECRKPGPGDRRS
jgi:SAM-dependent methyltransferase